MRAAKRYAWRAANAAARKNNQDALRAAGEIASTIRESATRATRRQADILCSYCAAALEKPKGQRSLLDSLFSSISRAPTRRCPECAETVKAAATRCRF